MDANDPPKTIATMQLIGSIFSNVSFFFTLSSAILFSGKEYFANSPKVYIASCSWC
jgi:hypothetical protein